MFGCVFVGIVLGRLHHFRNVKCLGPANPPEPFVSCLLCESQCGSFCWLCDTGAAVSQCPSARQGSFHSEVSFCLFRPSLHRVLHEHVNLSLIHI